MGRTQMVALWVPPLRNVYYGKVFDTFHKMFRSAGYETIYCEAVFTLGAETPYDWPVDGVIAVDAAELIAGAKLPLNMPIVSVGAYVDDRGDHVGVDLYQGAVQAVEHLAEIGCKRIAHVSFPFHLDDPVGRYAAYKSVLQKKGLTPELILSPNGHLDSVREAVRAHIDLHGKPDGFFCYNDSAAISLIRSLADLGLSVPKDCAVVGFDGLDILSRYVPTITSVEQPVDEMCKMSFEFLQTRIRDYTVPQQTATIAPNLVIRESTTR